MSAPPSASPPAGRVFSEREVAQIIERAVERQEEARRAVPEHGLTLAEIERLGREVGIDPAFLRSAAADVADAAGRVLARQSSQTHTHVVVERMLPGKPSEEGWEDAVVLLEERFGADSSALYGRAGGGVRQVGRMLEWSHLSSLGVTTRMSVTPRAGQTRVRMTQHVGLARPAAEGVAYGAVLALVAGVVPFVYLLGVDQPALAFALLGVLFPLCAVLVFHLDRQWRAKKLRQLDELADALAPLLAEAAPAETAPETASETASIGLREAVPVAAHVAAQSPRGSGRVRPPREAVPVAAHVAAAPAPLLTFPDAPDAGEAAAGGVEGPSGAARRTATRS